MAQRSWQYTKTRLRAKLKQDRPLRQLSEQESGTPLLHIYVYRIATRSRIYSMYKVIEIFHLMPDWFQFLARRLARR
jgi:hypothetical protein